MSPDPSPSSTAASPGTLPIAVFLALAGSVGAFFAITTPPHDPADEARHHARAWLVSHGRFGVVGLAPGHEAAIPREILRLHPPGHHHSEAQLRAGRFPRSTPPAPPHTFSELRTALDGPPAGAEFRHVRFLTAYNPAVYAPYAPAFWVAESLRLPVAVGLWLARGLGLAAWLLVVGIAIRRAPHHRWLLAAGALLPTSVFQAASISADPMTQAVALVFFAEWLRLAARDAPPRRAASYAGLGAAALALGLVKPGYAPLALACLGLPGTVGRRLALTALAFAAAALPTVAWLPFVAAAREPPHPGANPFAQLEVVLGDPLRFLGVVAGMLETEGVRWAVDLVGTLGHFDVEIPLGATALGFAALVAGGTLDGGPFPLRARLAAFAAALGCAFGLLTVAYLGWAPVGADSIPAFMPRYLLPLLPFAVAVVPSIARRAERPAALGTAAALAVVLGVAALAMLGTYYA